MKSYFKRYSLTGFTLIELVIVITILAIVAAVSIPLFVNLQQRAFHAQEVMIAAGLQEGVVLFYSKSVVEGNPHWYGAQAGEDDPLGDLLENPPPYVNGDPPNPGPGDGINWHYTQAGAPGEFFYIWCPHGGWTDYDNGNMWRYYYGGPDAGAVRNDRDEPVGVRWGYPGHD